MFGKLMRQAAVLLALGAMVAGDLRAEPFRAAGGGRGGDSDVCAAERAPILERQRQYQALKRSRVAKAAGEGLKKGAGFFAGAMLSRYAGGGGGSSGGGGGLGALASGLPFGGLPFGGGKSKAAPSPAPGGMAGGFLNAGVLSEASGFSIPGVTVGAGGSRMASGLGGDTKAIAAVAVIVAIAGTVEAYVRLKEAEANGDRARMVRSIEDDAGRQIPVSRAIAQEEAALAACLQAQVIDVDQHLASASNTSDRRQRASLIKAIHRDVDLTEDVCDQQATLAKTYTQGRAMTEGRSESDVLGGQAPAYADKASTDRLRMPDAPDAKVQKVSTKAAPAPPPPPTYSASRATVIRAAPNAKARALSSVAAGTVVPVRDFTGDTWVTVETSTGGVGYVLADHLAVSDGATATATPRGGGGGGGRFAAPSNVREHNKAVIQARDQGPNRLKSLLTNIEAA